MALVAMLGCDGPVAAALRHRRRHRHGAVAQYLDRGAAVRRRCRRLVRMAVAADGDGEQSDSNAISAALAASSMLLFAADALSIDMAGPAARRGDAGASRCLHGGSADLPGLRLRPTIAEWRTRACDTRFGGCHARRHVLDRSALAEGPFGSLDPLVKEMWYNQVDEGLPVWQVGWERPRPGLRSRSSGLSALCSPCRSLSGEERERWISYLFLLLAATWASAFVHPLRNDGEHHRVACNRLPLQRLIAVPESCR